MPKNCLVEFLTEDCERCPFWSSIENSVGCCIPAPIMECPSFAKMYEEEQKKAKEKE